jgi:hypothetical protein
MDGIGLVERNAGVVHLFGPQNIVLPNGELIDGVASDIKMANWNRFTVERKMYIMNSIIANLCIHVAM